MGNGELIISLVFGLFGFVISFFMSRSVNIIIFCGFTYAVFKTLEALNFNTDWLLFDNFVYTLSDLGGAVLNLVNHMLSNASTLSLILFIFGGAAGLALRKRGT